MLYKRYSSPMELLQQYVQTQSLAEFVEKFTDSVAKDLEEKVKWEYYLHRVFDKTYSEYIEATKPEETADMNDIEATVNTSINLLNGIQ